MRLRRGFVIGRESEHFLNLHHHCFGDNLVLIVNLRLRNKAGNSNNNLNFIVLSIILFV